MQARTLTVVFLIVALLLAAVGLAGCGGSAEVSDGQGSFTGSIRTSVSDPPLCKGPLAPSELNFNHVWVTITEVRAHISSDAPENGSGWQTLADLTANPMQIDLLGATGGQCILATLGTVTGLPAGRYQQIRLHLLANSASSGPSPNNCAAVNGWNCAEVVDGLGGTDLILLSLSSHAQTGLKIPPGQIAGGGLMLEADQAADINIDFNICSSIVEEGSGGLRLKPTLHAGEISTADTFSGRLVKQVNATTEPFTDVMGIVFFEQPQNGIDRVIFSTQTAADGRFNVCPAPPGSYDVVAAAQDGAGVTYNATVTFGVPAGTALGDIPMVPEAGPDTSPGEITGLVTTQDTGGMAATADIEVSPLQSATPSGGSALLVTIPTFGSSTVLFATVATGEEGETCPANTKCRTYHLFVPASNPQVGTFASGGTTYTAPAAGDVLYSINARAFVSGVSEKTDNCSPNSLTTDKQADGTTALSVTAGAATTAQQIDFTGCAVAP